MKQKAALGVWNFEQRKMLREYTGCGKVQEKGEMLQEKKLHPHDGGKGRESCRGQVGMKERSNLCSPT